MANSKYLNENGLAQLISLIKANDEQILERLQEHLNNFITDPEIDIMWNYNGVLGDNGCLDSRLVSDKWYLLGENNENSNTKYYSPEQIDIDHMMFTSVNKLNECTFEVDDEGAVNSETGGLIIAHCGDDDKDYLIYIKQ